MTIFFIDIGGTYIRFAQKGPKGPENICQYPLKNFNDPASALASKVSKTDRIYIACTGEMGPDGLWHMSNGPLWKIDVKKLSEQGYKIECFLNDFEAAAHAVTALGRDDLLPLHCPERDPINQNYALIGPGTGLGLAYIDRNIEGNPLIRTTCGGHMACAALNKEQFEVLDKVKKLTGRPCIYENLCSGSGLPVLYQAVTDQHCQSAQKALQHDKTRRLFHEFLGLFIHQAIVFGNSYGGVVLSGGVIHALLENKMLMAKKIVSHVHLEGVELMNGYIRSTPLWIARNYHITLQGLYERYLSDH